MPKHNPLNAIALDLGGKSGSKIAALLFSAPHLPGHTSSRGINPVPAWLGRRFAGGEPMSAGFT
ncbi:MAG TPA: hypothetical protein V6D03_07350 [Candidatus Caenarcaniphilales bacterium]